MRQEQIDTRETCIPHEVRSRHIGISDNVDKDKADKLDAISHTRIGTAQLCFASTSKPFLLALCAMMSLKRKRLNHGHLAHIKVFIISY